MTLWRGGIKYGAFVRSLSLKYCWGAEIVFKLGSKEDSYT